MATLAKDNNAQPIQVLTPTTTTTVSVANGSAVASSAIATSCKVLRIIATNDIYYTVDGTDASTGAVYLPANTIEYVKLNGSRTVSTYGKSATGVAHLTVMV